MRRGGGGEEVPAPTPSCEALLREAALQFTRSLPFEGYALHPRQRERRIFELLEHRIGALRGEAVRDSYASFGIAIEHLAVIGEVAEKDASLLGRLGSRNEFRVSWEAVRAVSFLQALFLKERGGASHLKQALSTWPPSGCDNIKSGVGGCAPSSRTL